MTPRIEALRRRLADCERARQDVLLADDLAMVTGAYQRADAVVREVQQQLADELARIEPIARRDGGRCRMKATTAGPWAALRNFASLPSDTPPPGILPSAWREALAAASHAIANAEGRDDE